MTFTYKTLLGLLLVLIAGTLAGIAAYDLTGSMVLDVMVSFIIGLVGGAWVFERLA